MAKYTEETKIKVYDIEKDLKKLGYRCFSYFSEGVGIIQLETNHIRRNNFFSPYNNKNILQSI